ncbi:HD domain-containing protein [Shimazuella kribbensis]|uniref:HD domain-containing protein n=1 Tax=Shimazuella kribbensis TaxID=139808 RepID=UPI00040F8D38|nr:HD domain-containing protein [Shimazuella kribbensis]
MDLFANANKRIPQMTREKLATYLDPKLPRFHHILGVVRNMEQLLPKITLPSGWSALLIQASYLHDIGYSPKLNQYNYHQLDGAVYAADQGFPKPIIATLLFHSCAYEGVLYSRPDLKEIYETHLRKLDTEDQMFIDLVSYCDLHTSANGEKTTLRARVDDVAVRYGKEHEVSKIMSANEPIFEEIIERVTRMIKE